MVNGICCTICSARRRTERPGRSRSLFPTASFRLRMNSRSLPVVFGLLELGQLLLPFGGSVSAARFVEELHQTMKGFFDPNLAITRNFVLPLLHALVAGQQQRSASAYFFCANKLPP